MGLPIAARPKVISANRNWPELRLERNCPHDSRRG
jgi:hypothetical protein